LAPEANDGACEGGADAAINDNSRGNYRQKRQAVSNRRNSVSPRLNAAFGNGIDRASFGDARHSSM
jgi:hypothetical protein